MHASTHSLIDLLYGCGCGWTNVGADHTSTTSTYTRVAALTRMQQQGQRDHGLHRATQPDTQPIRSGFNGACFAAKAYEAGVEGAGVLAVSRGCATGTVAALAVTTLGAGWAVGATSKLLHGGLCGLLERLGNHLGGETKVVAGIIETRVSGETKNIKTLKCIEVRQG
jgi:hypothetical protein